MLWRVRFGFFKEHVNIRNLFKYISCSNLCSYVNVVSRRITDTCPERPHRNFLTWLHHLQQVHICRSNWSYQFYVQSEAVSPLGPIKLVFGKWKALYAVIYSLDVPSAPRNRSANIIKKNNVALQVVKHTQENSTSCFQISGCFS